MTNLFKDEVNKTSKKIRDYHVEVLNKTKGIVMSYQRQDNQYTVCLCFSTQRTIRTQVPNKHLCMKELRKNRALYKEL